MIGAEGGSCRCCSWMTIIKLLQNGSTRPLVRALIGSRDRFYLYKQFQFDDFEHTNWPTAVNFRFIIEALMSLRCILENKATFWEIHLRFWFVVLFAECSVIMRNYRHRT
jgi:hypothetical protein